METHTKRNSFKGSIGFVLAAAGSAVGLGNIWRFPYLAAKDGGGMFLVIYIILALTFGFTLLITEVAIGRKTKQSPLIAYGKLNKKWKGLGVIACLVPIIILPYYCVIGGWVLKYFLVYLTGNGSSAAQDGYFTSFISGSYEPIIMLLLFLFATAFVIFRGVNKGIESFSKILMPILILLVVVIAIFSLTISHTDENGVTRTGLQGLMVYVVPNFEGMTIKSFFSVLLDAMGQLFFSLSVAMGIMIAYGSYVSDEADLKNSINQIEIFDTVIALLAGLMVVPAVYIFSGEAGMSQGGAGLMFITLPKVFSQMAGGRFRGALFFTLVLFAALTSSVSVMEAIVSMMMDRFGLSRIKCCIGIVLFSILLGVPCSLGNGIWSGFTIFGMDFLTFCDFISNSILLPVVAFLTCIMIGWFVGADYIIAEATKNGETFKRKNIYRIMIRYIAPVLLLIILVFYTLAQFGVIQY